jgi:hypothetical protein
MSIESFHKSTSKEFLALKDRVRDLVKQWGEDGKYKEAILRSAIERVLPKKYEIITGFVVKRDPKHLNEHVASKQIDIMIIDNTFPSLFRSNEFGVVTPDAVVAIIEVKANLEAQGISKVIAKANENGAFILSGKNNRQQILFNGIFSYEGCDETSDIDLERAYKNGSVEAAKNRYFQYFSVNHISFNSKWFLKWWEQEYGDPTKEICYLYEIPDLSFSFFIGSLMDHLASQSIKDNSTIGFPIVNGFKVSKKFRYPI